MKDLFPGLGHCRIARVSQGSDFKIEKLRAAEDPKVGFLTWKEIVKCVNRGGVGRDGPFTEADKNITFFQKRFTAVKGQ